MIDCKRMQTSNITFTLYSGEWIESGVFAVFFIDALICILLEISKHLHIHTYTPANNVNL